MLDGRRRLHVLNTAQSNVFSDSRVVFREPLEDGRDMPVVIARS